ncbi:flagellar type III secretion system pore protein FliP [Clostridium senegalense]|uniref:flagellar type III secretion system pore protein FliP n=1 Tax=Clostridium senegalense TaxID=1465809 RepID=UPI0002F27070|nr:flagellar type III secretion system pore protein FliP [Clostridium senegalense]MBU5225372.1 flagellar type III secretion system pore protein FliP [Clostridium senegalense]
MKNRQKKYVTTIMLALIISFIGYKAVSAAPNNTIPIPNINIDFKGGENPTDFVENIKILLALTVLTLLPSIIIMTTGFVRIVTVLSILKNAIGIQQSVPRQVIIGLSLFLTFFVMAPTITDINNNSIKPYMENKITTEVAYTNAINPMRDFMLRQTRTKDLKLFLEVGNLEDTVKYEKGKDNLEVPIYDDVPLYAIMPAFMISELRTAFEIGFLLFIPFLVIDIVTSSVLMAMGMFMLSPVMISLPFKLLLFVLVDGWNLISQSLIMSFK